ncbi:hypothetical protein PLESTB_001397800 [Pleodorina starrii]|uniref:RRM domain-containing protein n=1 Tax=Pleodorina starrii TaxID=330485 RepID=A0A9W6BUR7_9CHLO|nr:hypothetical protein PLESTM_000534500 [Pleodorina starrii]GLC58759.1 hypothetical protein PLESTB_001397800 [Pleodorina starrii]GLC75155.1 hypothetical protein PLESTF_001601200 [Pleodorina starrii]
MSSTSPNAAGSNDGPNKKSRLLELIQLPDSLDDAVLQPTSTSAQQQEAQLQLGTLQLGSGDEPASPKAAAAACGVEEDAAEATAPSASGTDAPMATDNRTAEASADDVATAAPAPSREAPQAGQIAAAAATSPDEPAGAPSHQREASLEPAPSDPVVCVSCDVGAGSSALEGLGGDEGEGEVASRQMGSASLAGGDGAGGGRSGGFEVFMGGLAPDAREEEVRRELEALAQGEVLSVRLQLTRGTSVCKGYGFATFADEASAQRAVSAAAAGARLCNRRVGLHTSRRPFRAVLTGAQAAGAAPPLHLAPDPAASINALLLELRGHPDRRAAVAAALQVVQRGAKRANQASAAATTMASPPATAVDIGGSGSGATRTVSPAAAAGVQRTAAGGKRQATAAMVETAATNAAAARTEEPRPAVVQNAAAATGGATKAAPAAAASPAPASAGTTKAADAAAKGNAAVVKDGAARAPAAAEAGSSAAAAGSANNIKAEKGAGGGGAATGGMSPDLMAALATYPKISKLLNSLKGTTRVPKTPLMVLHEYAAKMSYEVSYLETSDGPAGPYTVEARIMKSGPNSTTIAKASGKARTKKDAKQVSAAACLEKLLDGPRGLAPQDLLPTPKPPASSAAASSGGRTGRAAQERGGPGNNSSAGSGGGRKTPAGGRPGSGPSPGQFYNPHPHHRDALNRSGPPPPPPPQLKLPPPPPPHPHRGALMGGPGGGPSYGAGGGAGSLGPVGRGPFGGGPGGGYSAVQPGLHPAGGPVGGLGHGNGGACGAGSFGGAMDGHGGAGRGLRSGAEPYGGSGYGSGIGGYGGGGGGGGGGSMVQLGLGGGGGGAPASSSGGQYGSLYGREGARGGGGLHQDSYGGVPSYDTATGQKRNYSTAMQAAYGSPASSQGLLPVQPPQAPVSGGGMLGGVGVGGGSQGPFAVQAGGGGSRDGIGITTPGGMGGLQAAVAAAPPNVHAQQQPFLGQSRAQSIAGAFGQQAPIGQHPVLGGLQVPTTTQQPGSAYAQPLFSQGQQQQQQQQPSLVPLGASVVPAPQQTAYSGFGQAQQQQQQLGFSQQVLHGGSQTIQLQPVQPQSPFVQTRTEQQSAATQSGIYGISSYSQSQAAQHQYGAGGVYGGGMSQGQQGSVLGGSGGAPAQQPRQQQLQQPEPQSYGLSGHSGLQAFGGGRTGGGGLWG